MFLQSLGKIVLQLVGTFFLQLKHFFYNWNNCFTIAWNNFFTIAWNTFFFTISWNNCFTIGTIFLQWEKLFYNQLLGTIFLKSLGKIVLKLLRKFFYNWNNCFTIIAWNNFWQLEQLFYNCVGQFFYDCLEHLFSQQQLPTAALTAVVSNSS